MQCPNCGAGIKYGTKCEYCGTEITAEMKKERDAVNKRGCPNCGSSNVEFTRERQGEVAGDNVRKIVYYTVGICKDCGHTWRSDIDQSGNSDGKASTNKKSNMWIWVLGWICCFPIPITILVWRNEKWSKKTRYAIIAALWIVMLAVGALCNSKDSVNETNSTETAVEATIGQVETSDDIQFNEKEYDLKVEIADTSEYTVISVYGDSNDDFSEMLNVILDAAHAYGVKEDDTILTEYFNNNIGTEAGNNQVWEDAGIVTSAPNDIEDGYRADLYVNKK